MSDVLCDRCGSKTKPKQITSKKDGKQYTLYECLGACMSDNGKYKYSCFAPKVGKPTVQSSADVSEVKALLEEIKSVVLLINSKLPGKKAKKVIDVDSDEVPFPTDEDAPF